MKTIIWKEDSISPWIFDDAKIITMKSNQIDVGDPDNLEFIIGDMNLTVSGGLLGLLNGTYAGLGPSTAQYTAGSTNTFAGANVRALVIEVDVAKLADTGDFMQVWASTHKKP